MLTPPSPSKLRSVSARPTLYATPPASMSKLPTLATPSRLPGPSVGPRRPRSSLGGANTSHLGVPGDDAAMESALQEVLRTRPPSSLRNKVMQRDEEDPDTPTGMGQSLRSSAIRAKTPVMLGHGHATPSTSRAVSRSAARPSGNGATPVHGRRVSLANSSMANSTPHARRPESRLNGEHWQPVVGEKVRINSMGMEGTLRYMGETQFKAGTWAGVELEGGFAGKGKNDGSVNDIPYFSCPPFCGVFVLAVKLYPPTAGVSRPASVASSSRSYVSSQLSAANGRTTPALGRSQMNTMTPARARNVSTATIRARNDDGPVRTLLGNSSSSNAAIAESKITAGSKASRYLGMTAKQLEQRNGSLIVSTKGGATPKAPRMSLGGPTPARPRQSLGTSMITPRPKAPRASNAADAMPPPPSPGHATRVLQAQQAQLEEELVLIRIRNAELEAQLAVGGGEGEDEQQNALGIDIAQMMEEAEALRSQLQTSHANATDASKLADELRLTQIGLHNELDAKKREISDLRREVNLVSERAQGELEAGLEARQAEMQAKDAELLKMREKMDSAEQDNDNLRALAEELTQAGQATISLYETKQYEFEDRNRSLEEKVRLLEDRLAKAREEQQASIGSKEAMTAAEIDNETLTAQLKHFQNRVSSLEEELEEVRTQAETDAESWKARLTKAKDAGQAGVDREKALKESIKKLEKTAAGAKTRIEEMDGALKENRGLLETARAEIESLRSEAAEAATMRAALQAANDNEKALADRDVQIAQWKQRHEEARSVAADKVAALETEIASLENRLAAPSKPPPASPTPSKGRLSIGSNGDDADKRLRGFQHIISDLSNENAELKEKYRNIEEEIELLKEENKLLEETRELGSPNGDGAALAASKETVEDQAKQIKALNREVAELESLVESKIYKEDELETRLADLERQLHRSAARQPHSPTQSMHSRNTSNAGSAHSTERCELCDGPHELDACPLMAGNLMADAPAPSTLKAVNGGGGHKKAKWCADCESAEHDTADCPVAGDVF